MKLATAAVVSFALVALVPFASARSAPVRQTQSAPAPHMMKLVDLRQMMVGTWQSMDDPRFTREFNENGQTVDRYAGDDSATTHGVWDVFVGSHPPPEVKGQALQPAAVYVVLMTQGDVLLFGLVRADQSHLQMIYLGRGNMLNFSRLK